VVLATSAAIGAYRVALNNGPSPFIWTAAPTRWILRKVRLGH
jgi:hypothetical protein